jgi:hypothetical protein
MNTIAKNTVNRERSPSPGVPALVYFILFVGGFVFNQISTSGASFPTPYDPVQKAQEYYQHFQSTTRIYSFFIFWSALPLGIFTAFFTSRLFNLGIHRGGLNIAAFGGYAAAVFIALSGLCTWILSQPNIATEPGITRGIQLLGFASGGTGNVVFAGLLIAGISVTAGLALLIPKWIMWSGLILAAISLLSMFNMIFEGVSILLPIGRFLGIIWMIIAGFKLKKEKPLG